MKNQEIIQTVSRSLLFPSPLNPRKTFDADMLFELGINIRERGIINPLIVRKSIDAAIEGFEIICGECRWRSGDALPIPGKDGKLLGPMDQYPIIVREMTDSEAFETMLSENMKRRDLTALEEMGAFVKMLAEVIPNPAGDGNIPRYTISTLAQTIGVSEGFIDQRLRLRKLTKIGRDALASGRIPFRTARVICSCPDAVVEKVEDEVLNPKKYEPWRDNNDPLTAAETLDLIHQKYVRDLRNAPFELTKKDLVPEHCGEGGDRIEGGACTDCPWNSRNQAGEETDGRKAGLNCLNPACFAKKVEVNVSVELVKAKDRGAKILTEVEARRALSYNSPYVKLDAKPDCSDLAPGVSEKKAPTWDKLVNGKGKASVVVGHTKEGDSVSEEVTGAVGVQELIAVVDGKVHRLVDRKVAIAAAQKNGHEKILSLSSGRGRSAQDDDYAAQQKKEREKAKERGECARAVMAALVTAIEYSQELTTSDVELWSVLREINVGHAAHSGCGWVCSRRGIDKKPDVYTAIRAHAGKLMGNSVVAMGVELLLSQGFSYSDGMNSGGEIVSGHYKGVFMFFGVDYKRIIEETKAAIADRKKAKNAGKKKAESPAYAIGTVDGGVGKDVAAAAKKVLSKRIPNRNPRRSR